MVLWSPLPTSLSEPSVSSPGSWVKNVLVGSLTHLFHLTENHWCVCTCTCVEGHTEVNKWTHQSLTRLGENRASTSSNQPQNHSHRPRILSLTFKLGL